MTPMHISAVLQLRCEASGSAYAIFWQEDGERLVVGGDYVTPARRAALSALGKHTTYAEASRRVVLDAGGNSPVASALKRRASALGRQMRRDDGQDVLGECQEAYTPPITPPSSPRPPARARTRNMEAQSARLRPAGDSWLDRAMLRMASHEVRAPATTWFAPPLFATSTGHRTF